MTNRLSKLKNNKKIIIPLLTGIIIFFASCGKDSIEKVNAITSEINAPNIAIINTEIIYSEQALIKVKVTSKELNRYLEIENPYTEFPQGLFVEFYDSTGVSYSYIRADYCIYDETEKTWTAKNDVESVNSDGDTLNTEFLIWNMETERVYSDQYVRITNKDGIIHGKGFEANQDFSDWKILGSSGTISVENEK
ncbi:MAG: LPS export ABC transporter periplasmic protein LptC [Bacteroidales bacterium]|nr:LPS export ABC transporter periplasmic protein LptC [Bacteroidales bacterium]